MIRIFFIEDHPVTIAGLRTYFRRGRDQIFISVAVENIQQAVTIDNDSFDLIMLDYWLKESDTGENLAILRSRFPDKPIVIYSGEQMLVYQRIAFKGGVKGFLSKHASKQLIQETLERVMKGELVYSTLMAEYKSKRIIKGYKDPKYGLTREQKDIIALFIEGLPSKTIAGRIGKDPSSVNKSMKIIRDIFNVSNNIDLVKTLMNLDEFRDKSSDY